MYQDHIQPLYEADRTKTMNATLHKPTSQSVGRLKPQPTPTLAPATKVTGGLTQIHRISLDEVCAIFIPTPHTAPAEVPADSTRQIPQPSELSCRKATNLKGEAEFQVVWDFTRLGGQESDEIIVATADPILGNKEFPEFMRHYSNSGQAGRAEILGRKDWVELQRYLIAQSVGRPRSQSTSPTQSSYQPKIVLTPSHTHSSTVMLGQSAGGKKRLTWMGHSAFALARYLGHHGWTGGQAVDTFEKIGLPMGKAAIIGGVYAGKSGKRGDPAKVTPDQHQILLGHLKPLLEAKAKYNADDEANRKEAANPTITKPLPPNVPNKPLPNLPLTRKGSKADHEAKLQAAMTAKANERKANKQAATTKAMATKATNKAQTTKVAKVTQVKRK